MIVVAGTATIKPEIWDEAVQQAQRMSAATEAENGCISYRIYINPIERNTFFIFEEWETEEALIRHFQTPHLQAFSAYLGSALTDGMNIKRYIVSEVAPL
jgi:quinol monooxygenase YgiN